MTTNYEYALKDEIGSLEGHIRRLSLSNEAMGVQLRHAEIERDALRLGLKAKAAEFEQADGLAEALAGAILNGFRPDEIVRRARAYVSAFGGPSPEQLGGHPPPLVESWDEHRYLTADQPHSYEPPMTDEPPPCVICGGGLGAAIHE